MYRPFVILAGLAGAAGVAVSAAASHSGDTNLAIAGNFLLIHAPALLAIASLPRTRLLTGATIVLIAGLALFTGDLAVRALAGRSLFAFAAPLGGGGLILGWLGIAAAGLWPRR